MNEFEYERKKDELVGWFKKDIELKGVPGKMHFSIVREILSKGCDGVIFLIDGCDVESFQGALEILEETREVLGQKIPMIIIANKSDREDYQGCERISGIVGEDVIEGSGKTQRGIKEAIIHLSQLILEKKIES